LLDLFRADTVGLAGLAHKIKHLSLRPSPHDGRCGIFAGPQSHTFSEVQITAAMNDTSAAISKLVVDRYRSMTPSERCLVASSLFETARKIVESSLPSSLTLEQRRLAVVRRLYQSELPEVALIAHARYVDSATPYKRRRDAGSEEALCELAALAR
jgi:hypothetical protein